MKIYHSIILVILLLVSSLGPLALHDLEGPQSLTSGRSVDISVDSVEIVSPSAVIAGVHTLATGTQEVRIRLVNLGTTSATGTLDLEVAVNGGTPSTVDTVAISIGGGSSATYLMEWVQTSGTADVSASVTVGADSDLSNNQDSIPDTLTIEDRSDYLVVSDTLPNDGAIIGRDMWHGDWVFTNTGNIPFDAEGRPHGNEMNHEASKQKNVGGSF